VYAYWRSNRMVRKRGKQIGLSKWRAKNRRLAREGKPPTIRADSRADIGYRHRDSRLARLRRKQPDEPTS